MGPHLPSARILVALFSQNPHPGFLPLTPSAPWLEPTWAPVFRVEHCLSPLTGRPHPSPRRLEESYVVFNKCHK